MFENKINELEKELARKTSSVSELKQRLKEARQREEEAQISIRQLQDQVTAADQRSGAERPGGRPKQLWFRS